MIQAMLGLTIEAARVWSDRISWATSPLTDGVSEQKDQYSNRINQLAIPPAALLTTAMWRHQLGFGEFTFGMEARGAAITGSPVLTNFETDTRIKLWRESAKQFLSYPDPGDVIRANHRGLIKGEHADTIWRHSLGFGPDYTAIADLYRPSPTQLQITELMWRELISKDRWNEEIVHWHGFDEDWTANLKELTKLVASPSDLIQFAIKDVFDTEGARLLGLFDEIPEQVRKYFAWQGLDWPLDEKIVVGGTERNATWLDLYWGSHWRNIAPEMQYRWHQKFRPGRAGIGEGFQFQVKPFERDDLEKLLKFSDYPSGVRDWLVADAYSTPNLRDLRRLYLYDAITEDQFKEYLLDRGFNPVDVPLIVNGEHEAKDRKLEEPSAKKWALEVLKDYKLGILPRENADNALAAANYTEQARLFELGRVEQERSREIASKLLSTVRRDYFLGGVTSEVAERTLVAGGFELPVASQYVRGWQLELTLPRKAASADRIIKWVCKHYITFAEGESRLQVLGWQQADILLLLNEAQACIDADILKAQKEAARNLAQQRRADRAAAREADRACSEARTRILAHGSLAELADWGNEGLIEWEAIASRLRQMCWPEDDIGRWIANHRE